MSLIANPILPGFNPDPSILRVENDYYLFPVQGCAGRMNHRGATAAQELGPVPGSDATL